MGRGVRVTRLRGAAQVQRERAGTWTKAKRTEFLEQLAATANVRASARAVGMSEPGVYRLRQRSAEFRAAWAVALSEGYAKLELMLLERAMNGTVKPIFQLGKEVGSVTEYSDRLALTLLNAHRATVHRERVGAGEDPEETRRRISATLAEMNLRMGGDG